MKKTLLAILTLICGTIYSDTYSENTNADVYKELLRLHGEIGSLTDRVRALEDIVKTLPEFKNETSAIDIPCMEEAYDSDTEFGEIGIAEAPTQKEAKEKAIRQACEAIAIKVYPEMISYYISSTKDKTESRIENNITEAQIQTVYSKCNMACYNIQMKPTGVYEAFVAIRLSKSVIKNNNQ